MNRTIEILKGLHPGIVLERELKKRGLAKGPFALSINEFPQTISAITKGKRGMNTPLAMRIEKALGIEEGFFMTLQVFYEIKGEKKKQIELIKPNLNLLRPALFWDTQFDKIDWKRQKRAVIERVWERGNEEEKTEIGRFYGTHEVDKILAEKLNKN
jgi:plasmid maintenance system antidote protein VapI